MFGDFLLMHDVSVAAAQERRQACISEQGSVKTKARVQRTRMKQEDANRRVRLTAISD
jgi:hypothetical protein